MTGAVALFVCTLALSWVIGFVVAAHAAHYFLSIAESSATLLARNVPGREQLVRQGGRDNIDWPDETIADYFVKVFYFGYMVALFGGPAILMARVVVGPSPWAMALAGAAFWLFFPIGQLSSLASGSRWNPFWPDLLVAFARRPFKTLAFYLLSAPVVAGLFLTFDLIFLRTSAVGTIWAIALSPIAVVLFFIYARLIGRLGMVVSFALPRAEPETKKRRPKRKRPVQEYDPKTRWAVPKDLTDQPSANAQPEDLPGIETPDEGIVTGYGVNYDGTFAPEEEEEKPVRIVHKFDDEDDRPITVAPAVDTRGTDRQRIAVELAEPPEHEIAMRLRERPTEPANPYGAELVTFLLDPKAIEPWLKLTAGLIGMALLLRFLNALRLPLE
jgi:hypothetical protein